MDDILTGAGLIFFVFIGAALFGLLLAFPIMWCWNYTMPAMFGLIKITWGQAWCLNFLSSMFIKSTVTTPNNSK